MPTTVTNTGITFNDSTSITTNPIPSGTVMIFRQSAAPTGWTKITSGVNDMALRVVTGDVTNRTNGTAFSAVMSNKIPTGSVSGVTATAQLSGTTSSTSLSVVTGSVTVNNGSQATVAQNNASITPDPHSHTFVLNDHSHSINIEGMTFSGNTMTFNTNYVDVILATKN
jgi:hypothetical protein